MEDPTAEIMRFTEPFRNPAPRPASHECVQALISHRDDQTAGMAVLGAAGGLRRAEIGMVCGVDFSYVNERWQLRIQGKGNKIRTVVMGAHAMAIISRICVPGKSTGRLFRHLSSDETKVGDQVGDILAAAAKEAGHTMTAHQLRHYAATTLWQATRNLEAVRQMLGHSDMNTTIRYVEAWTSEIANDSADALDAIIGRLADTATHNAMGVAA
jgi:integrase